MIKLFSRPVQFAVLTVVTPFICADAFASEVTPQPAPAPQVQSITPQSRPEKPNGPTGFSGCLDPESVPSYADGMTGVVCPNGWQYFWNKDGSSMVILPPVYRELQKNSQ